MSDEAWRRLILEFVERRIDERAFHDLFFDHWHRASAADWRGPPPAAVEKLFYVVEAYCPDPALRDPSSPYEADARELGDAAQRALAELCDGRPE